MMLAPDTAVSQGTYDDKLTVYSDNHIPYTYHVQITVSSDAVGSVLFDVLDELMEDVAGADITLQNQTLYELIYRVKTGADGTVLVGDIPEGRYTYNISAPGHVPTSGSFTVEPGLVKTVPIAMEVTLVDIEWSVTPVPLEDRYEITIIQTFETNVPAPVLVMDPPSINVPVMQPGEVFQGELTVTNHGLVELFDFHLEYPTRVDEYDIEVFTEAVSDKLGAMQSVTVPYRITKRATAETVQTSSLYDEVKGYGGSADCAARVTIKAVGKCIICPNEPQESVATKVASALINIFRGLASCAVSGGWSDSIFDGGGGTYTGGGGTATQTTTGGNLPSGASAQVLAATCHDSVPKAGDTCTEEGEAVDSSGADCNDLVCTKQADGSLTYDSKPDDTEEPDATNPLLGCSGGEAQPRTCDTSSGYSSSQNRYDNIIMCEAIASGVNPQTIKDVISAESDFDKNAYRGGDSSTGLMQVIPSTARSLGLTGTDAEIIEQLKNPCTNIKTGAAYLAESMGKPKQLLDDAGIKYDAEDLRVYAEAYFNAGPEVFKYAVELVKTHGFTINSWEDFTVPQEKLGGVSIMRKAIEVKLSKYGKSCSGPIGDGDDSKLPYDKDKNNAISEQEWYDWRTYKVLQSDRMEDVAEAYKERGLNMCPTGTFSCDEAKKNEECSK